MTKVSVIIPVYNVSPYIARCLHTLFSQTLDLIEYIFVDDASTDNSIIILNQILKQYPSRISQVKILKHTINMGLAAARTTGIKAATGEFIIHCDPDDYIETNMYEILYNKAIKTNSDITMCDYYYVTNTMKISHSIKKYSKPQDYLLNWFRNKTDYSSVVNKLVKRSFILKNEIWPYPGIDHGEDFCCSIRFFLFANSISIINKPLYYYCKNEFSMTSKPLTMELFRRKMILIDNVCKLFSKKNEFNSFCNNLKFNIKMGGRHLYVNNKKEWYNLYKESHKSILKYKDYSLKVRIFMYIFFKNFYIFELLNKRLKFL